MSINNNHNMLSTTNNKTSATTTANTTISNNTTGGTNTTSSCPSSPLAAAMVQQQKQQQQALKCPRCDSSNTKFCYYNNYSLSQPRHFCKACKRYWTRGGTLRNVPVGGGCRKNKRVKKAPATATTCSAAVTASNPKNSSLLSPLPHPSATTTTTSDHLNSLFFDLLPNSAAAVASSMNLASTTSPFPTLPQMYDLQPQMSALGVRFSPQKFQLGFASSSLADLQQSGSSLLNSYQPPYDQELRVETNGIFELPKQVKEEGKNNVNGSDDGVGIEWQDQDPYYNMTQFDVAAANIAAAGVSSGDSSYLYWSSAILGGGAGWPDIVNSSIAPLI